MGLIKKVNGYTSPASVRRERWRLEAAEAAKKAAKKGKPPKKTPPPTIREDKTGDEGEDK